MKIATSLADNTFFYGLSALINSMIKYGTYFDKFVVGYKGALPTWLPALSETKNGRSFKTSKGFEVEFVEITGDLNMVHEKPNWLYHLNTNLEPSAEEYCFFDSDLIILNRMTFFGEWIQKGVALCEDINGDMPDNYPIRLEWKKIALERGMEIKNKTEKYYNSGFVGWNKANADFIKDWVKCFDILAEFAGNLKRARSYDRTYPVNSANQDSLNVAYMITSCNLSTIGPEAMGFKYGLKLMAHPIGKNKDKPWERNYFIEFLKGRPPRSADLSFWHFANSKELKPYPQLFVRYKIFICKLLKGLSRFYGQKIN
ncbi:MAG: hypothetical protein ABJB11_03965 [Ferruginibacter sp.]